MEQKERIRTSISPLGLNTSTPDNVVEDGSLEVCHNLRFANGAWRNVQEFEVKPMPRIEEYEILYKHPATPENNYIAIGKRATTNDTPVWYGYVNNDELFYAPLQLSNNEVLERPFYDNNLSKLGYIVDCEEYADGTAGATILTTPALDTLRVYGFNITARDNDAPMIEQLYFPEGRPTIGSIAMQYGANGRGEFSYYGTIKDYDGSSIYLSNINEQNVNPERIYTYSVVSDTFIDVFNSHIKMYRVEQNGKTLYLPDSNFDNLVDSLAYLEEDGEFKLCLINKAVEVPNNNELRYIVMERYFAGVQTLSIPFSAEIAEVFWKTEYSLTRFPSADKTNEASYRSIYALSIDGDDVTIKQEISKVSGDVFVSHFGNMLILRQPQKQKAQYFLLDNDQYRPYANDLQLSFTMSDDGRSAPANVKWALQSSLGVYSVVTWEKVFDSSTDSRTPLSTIEDNAFRGELAIFAALRSESGSILYRTPVQIYNSIDSNNDSLSITTIPKEFFNEENKGECGVVGETILRESEYNMLQKYPDSEIGKNFCPESSKFRNVRIEFNGSILHEDVYDIAFYSTRLFPLTIGDNINDVDLLQENFHLLHSIRKGDVSSNSELSFLIDADMLDKVANNPRYEPSQSTSLYGEQIIEYNNRIHLLGVYSASSNTNVRALRTISQYSANEAYRTMAILQRSYENQICQYQFSATNLADEDNTSLAYDEEQPFIWSFEGNLSRIYFANDNLEYSNIFDLKYSPTIDVSYIVQLSTNPQDRFSQRNHKYEKIILSNEKVGTIAGTHKSSVLSPNRLQVSELNDPYTYPFVNSYRIGSATNRIITANSAAIEMSDAKFGEFPLYVFTTEGIYAMQSGTESLYSAIIPIAKDVAINPHTLAVNGAVLFFTDKGLHMLSQNGVQLISAGLHEDNNRIPEWMSTCRMVHLPEYNEVMCLLMDGEYTTDKAYVLSLDNKCWSERNIPQGQLLNNNEVLGVNSSHNLENEGESLVATIELETRPIKLGANKELKRLETLIVRFEADQEEELEIIIKGSIDGVEYKDLRKVSATTNTDVLIRRTPASVKYLKFVVKSDSLQSSIRLIRFDTEHYLRFVRRMR